jgi:hypothetical protein
MMPGPRGIDKMQKVRGLDRRLMFYLPNRQLLRTESVEGSTKVDRVIRRL